MVEAVNGVGDLFSDEEEGLLLSCFSSIILLSLLATIVSVTILLLLLLLLAVDADADAEVDGPVSLLFFVDGPALLLFFVNREKPAFVSVTLLLLILLLLTLLLPFVADDDADDPPLLFLVENREKPKVILGLAVPSLSTIP